MSLHTHRAAHRVLGPVLERWLASATDRRGELPTPTDEPRVYAAGPDPDRILLMGGGVVHGHGVTSHQLGLGGHLARRVSARTGRGADVDIQWRPMMSPATAAEMLLTTDLTRFDAVIIFLGSREAVSLMPPADWQVQLSAVMDAVGTNAPRHLPVFLGGIPQMPDFLALPGFVRSSIMRRTNQLNEETEHLCLASHRVSFLPISVARGSLRTYGDTATYDRWAREMAPAIARALDAAAPESHEALPVDEAARRRALRRLEKALELEADDRFDKIARTARDLLGATAASIAFLGENDPLVKTIQGGETRAPDRSESFMVATIEQPEALVVEGDELVERFGHHPWVTGPERVRFYAGYPIESPDGYRVGALAVVGPQPRSFTAADEALLRDLALRVQSLVWGDARV